MPRQKNRGSYSSLGDLSIVVKKLEISRDALLLK
jgi:hypothetical protein